MIRKITIFFFMICSLIGYSQSEYESYSDFNSKNRMSFFTNLGFSLSNEITPINDFLNSNDFPQASKVWYDWNYFGIEGQYKRFIFKMNLFHSFNSNEQTYNTNDNKSELTINGISGVFGYEVLSKSYWSVFPLVGFETSGLWLELTKPISDSSSLNDLVSSPNIVKINKSNFLLKGELGIRRMPDNTFSYGIYIGYKHDITKNNWRYQDIKFDDNPKINMSGFYMNFSVQINIFH